jgi:cell division protein FtsB
MDYKFYKLRGRIAKVESTNKRRINDLVSLGFREVDIKGEKVTFKGEVAPKEYAKVLAENKKLKAKIKKLETPTT